MHLTERQTQILTFISMFEVVKGCSPTYPEIGNAFNFGVRAALDNVNALKRKGCLFKTPKGLQRSFRLTPKGRKVVDLKHTTLAIDTETMVAYEVAKLDEAVSVR